MSTKRIPSLKQHYIDVIIPALITSRGYKNTQQVPKLTKISLNTGIDAEADKNQIADIQRDLTALAGQKAILAKSKKAISNFKLRQGQVVGAHVTLRGDSMWDFLYRLIAVALPTIRDFRGVHSKLDGQGNYALGINDFTIFPEINVESVKKTMGLDINIVTTAETDDEGRELLKLLGMPFRRTEAQQAADAAAKNKAA
jgi:large subunit ribosomal protein L5